MVTYFLFFAVTIIATITASNTTAPKIHFQVDTFSTSTGTASSASAGSASVAGAASASGAAATGGALTSAGAVAAAAAFCPTTK